MKNARIFAIFIIVAAVIWIAGNILIKGNQSKELQITAAMQKEQTAPIVLKKASVAEEKSRTLRLLGQTSANKTVKLVSKTNGEILEIFFDVGQYVKEGQVMARISEETRPQQLRQAEATVADAKANYEAVKKLVEKKFRSENQLTAAEAQLALAEANLEAVKLDIEYTEITAPFSGIVENKQIDVGSVVNTGAIVADLLQTDPLMVTIHVSESFIHQVSIDSPAVVLIGGEEFEAKVANISSRANDLTRTFAVDVSVENKEKKLNSGQTATVLLSLSKVWSHFVSPAFITINEEGQFGIKAVDEQGKVIFYSAEMVDDTSDGIWVTGLPQKLDIITLGSAYVKEGHKVEAYFSQEEAYKAAMSKDLQAEIEQKNPQKIIKEAEEKKQKAVEALKKAKADLKEAEKNKKFIKAQSKNLEKQYKEAVQKLSHIEKAEEQLEQAQKDLRIAEQKVKDAQENLEKTEKAENLSVETQGE